jgi:hypothetical protein
MQYGQMYLPKIFQKVITYYLFISIIFFTTKCKNTMLINVIHVYRENESVNQESRSTGNSGDTRRIQIKHKKPAQKTKKISKTDPTGGQLEFHL